MHQWVHSCLLKSQVGKCRSGCVQCLSIDAEWFARDGTLVRAHTYFTPRRLSSQLLQSARFHRPFCCKQVLRLLHGCGRWTAWLRLLLFNRWQKLCLRTSVTSFYLMDTPCCKARRAKQDRQSLKKPIKNPCTRSSAAWAHCNETKCISCPCQVLHLRQPSQGVPLQASALEVVHATSHNRKAQQGS